jgi:hypothetical protein
MIPLYLKGMSSHDIEAQLWEIYKLNLSKSPFPVALPKPMKTCSRGNKGHCKRFIALSGWTALQ